MSWATTFWDIEHLVESSRRAMEAAYIADNEATFNAPSAVEDEAVAAMKLMESSITSAKSMAAGDPLENLSASMKKLSLTDKQPTQPVSAAKLTSPWTSEIEAALRAFLRPFSMHLRYEYQFSDMLDEKTSIETMNSLLKLPAKPDDDSTRDDSLREEMRRKRVNELRRTGTRSKNV